MKLMKRNLRSVWYCLFDREEVIPGDDDYESGEKRIIYQEPVEIKANVSPATGAIQTMMFGSFENYDKVLIVEDVNCPVDESSVFYIDTDPNGDGASYDYVVKRVARSLNSAAIAVSKVQVS